jgi:hypothetical protein
MRAACDAPLLRINAAFGEKDEILDCRAHRSARWHCKHTRRWLAGSETLEGVADQGGDVVCQQDPALPGCPLQHGRISGA